VKRRQFITMVGGAAAWPLAVRAQPSSTPIVGWLSSRAASADARFLPAFREVLGAQGFTEGRNLTIEYRYADAQIDRLPMLAADLVSRRPAVIATVGSAIPATRAVQAASAQMPVIGMFGGVDPVKAGLVASLNRPGGNVTGVITYLSQVVAKRLGLLHDLVPQARTIAVLVNPTEQSAPQQLQEVQDAAGALGLEAKVVNATSANELAGALASLSEMRPDALFVTISPLLFISRVDQIVEAASRLAIPSSFYRREFVVVGGLMSYASPVGETYGLLANYVARILKGAKPADLPIQQSSKLELVLNLKTAKALGITIPPGVLAIADEVME
jgi:putative tryptophan/tyrosine transport system substrate-binding protein